MSRDTLFPSGLRSTTSSLVRGDHRQVLPTYLGDRRSVAGRVVLAAGLLGLLAIAFAFGRQVVAAPQMLTILMAPLAVLALVIVWALPERDNPPIAMMEFCFFAVLVALVLWPNYLGFSIPGLPWITMIRLFGLPMFFCLMMSISVSPAFRRDLGESMSVAPIVWKMLVALTVCQLIAMPFSRPIGMALQRTVLYQVYGPAMLVAAAFVCARPGRAMLWAVLFTAMAVPICVIGLMEQDRQQVLWAGSIPSFLTIEDPIVALILEPKARAANGIYRVQGPHTTPLGLAEYLAFVMPFIVHTAAAAPHKFLRLSAVAMIPVMFLVILATDSRLGMVGFFMSLLLYALAWGTRRWHHERGSIMGPAVTLSFPLAAMSIVAASFVVGRFRHLIWGSGAQQYSTDARKTQVLMGIPKILRRPIGYGVGRSGDILGYTNLAGVQTIDSYYLALALDVGPVGLILFISVFAVTMVKALFGAMRAGTEEERLLTPICISLANFLVIKSIFAQDANNTMVFMMAGVALALLRRQRDRIKREVADAG